MAERDDPHFPPLDPELMPGEGEEDAPSGGRGFLPDGVRKAILAGVGALFMTEEGARRLARDWKLPKEVIGFIGQQAQSAKDEVMRVFAEEVRHFLESDAVRRELGRVLESMAVEVKAEIRFKRADDGTSRPEVKASVTPAARRRKGKGRR
jgi:hypothetical protein